VVQHIVLHVSMLVQVICPSDTATAQLLAAAAAVDVCERRVGTNMQSTVCDYRSKYIDICCRRLPVGIS
jgi:hypothetical protein